MSLKHLIIVSLCLLSIITNSNAAPEGKPTSDEKTEKNPDKTVSKQESKLEPLEEPEEPKEDPKVELKRVELVKAGDFYAIVKLLVDPKVKENKISAVSMIYAIEKPNEKGEKVWVYSNVDGSINKGTAFKNIAKKRAGDYYQYDMEVYNIEPESKIKLKFTAFYGKESIELEEIEVKTKPKAPEIKTTSQLLTLQFENPNAIKYFAKVNKIKDGKEDDCVLDVTMSHCFGNSLGLPGLITGEKYSIKVWYIKEDKTESEVTTQEVTAQ